MALGGGSTFTCAFDFMAALSVLTLAACFYAVLSMAAEEQEKEAKKNEHF